MAGLGDGEPAPPGIEDGVHAGGQQRLVRPLGEVVGQFVDVPQQDVGRQVERGQHPDGRPQPAHRGGGPQAVPHDVADHQGGALPGSGITSNQSPPTSVPLLPGTYR
ncbi:hypothetical protein GCM10025734_52070 [Kitasatospora paranensis]